MISSGELVGLAKTTRSRRQVPLLRSTFASHALAAGVGIHALARIMGTSVAMIERHYGTLLDGAMESITGRLDAFDAEHEQEQWPSRIENRTHSLRRRPRFQFVA
jgi:integrase